MILCCFKAYSFTSNLLNHLFSEMGLFALYNCCVLFIFDYLKLLFEFKSRLHIPEVSGYHCINDWMNKLILCTAPTNIVEIVLIGNIKLHLMLHILYSVSILRFFNILLFLHPFNCILYPILYLVFYCLYLYISLCSESCILHTKKWQKFYIFFEIFCIICLAKMLQFLRNRLIRYFAKKKWNISNFR